MFDPEKMAARFHGFRKIDYSTYPFCFGEFWKRKIRIETAGQHILDSGNFELTCAKLEKTLRIWQWHRPSKFETLAPRLKNALRNMLTSYETIKEYSLLEFDKIPDNDLALVWHELGSVKNGEKNGGGYYSAMATTKPLMFLWGQTPAFDSVVRGFMPRFNLNGLGDCYWTYNTWKTVMSKFAQSVKEQPEILLLFRRLSQEEYETEDVVPYGQFIDLYYWMKER